VIGVERRVFALATARAADAFGNSFLIVVLPVYLASEAIPGGLFGLPEAAAIGVVLSTLGVVNSSLQPLVGRASDRFGHSRRFVLVGLVLLAGANLAYVLAASWWQVLALRIVQGVAIALAVPCTLALVSEFATTGRRGASMGVYNSVRMTGYAAGPVLAGLLVDHGPYATPIGPPHRVSGRVRSRRARRDRRGRARARSR